MGNSEMNSTEWRMFNGDSKEFKFYADNRKYCSNCGHSMLIGEKRKRTICTHCGNWVYRHKQDEFKAKVMEALRNGNKS